MMFPQIFLSHILRTLGISMLAQSPQHSYLCPLSILLRCKLHR